MPTKMIDVRLNSGKELTVKATTVGRGLAVHRKVNTTSQRMLWTVTHLSTGNTVATDLRFKKTAMKVGRLVRKEFPEIVDAETHEEVKRLTQGYSSDKVERLQAITRGEFESVDPVLKVLTVPMGDAVDIRPLYEDARGEHSSAWHRLRRENRNPVVMRSEPPRILDRRVLTAVLWRLLQLGEQTAAVSLDLDWDGEGEQPDTAFLRIEAGAPDTRAVCRIRTRRAD